MGIHGVRDKLEKSRDYFLYYSNQLIENSGCDDDAKSIMQKIVAQAELTFDECKKAIADCEKNT